MIATACPLLVPGGGTSVPSGACIPASRDMKTISSSSSRVGTGSGIGPVIDGGLVVHSFFDGISIGSAFIIDRALGLLVFTAIVLHKAPEGFAIASVVLATRGSRRSALLAAAAVGAASILGGFSIFGMQTLVGPALAVSAGVTLYVAASDLVPEVNREQGLAIALTVFLGVLLYYATERMLDALGL